MLIFLATSALFATLALLFAADAALISFDLATYFGGIRWLRIHPITLGVVTEAAFGLLPGLVAARAGRPRPKARLDQWLLLTVGILVLLAGIPLINGALILTGGTLIFAAAVLLARQLWQLGEVVEPPADREGAPNARRADATDETAASGRPFYIMALLYLLLGIVVGTGMWIGWGPILRIKIPLEVHIHANNWGFASLLFAGLLVDLYPTLCGRPLRWPGSTRAILWAMSLGALGLVLGPWTGSALFTVPGIVLHLAATFALLANVMLPLRGDPLARTPGAAMLIGSYVWILLPVLMAPFVLTGAGGLDGAGIEANAPQALIYGWLLQFASALLPPLFWRAVVRSRAADAPRPSDVEPPRAALPVARPAALGGSWPAFGALNGGAILLWASIFAGDLAAPLHGGAYALWTLAVAALAWELVSMLRVGEG